MDTRPPDLIPFRVPRAASQSSAAPRRGGPRPGSGPPKGNLNAFKHGRYSRFRDLLPNPQPVAAAAAKRLITREQRAAERHAANLLLLARHARYSADYAAAVAEGRPLPPPPLLPLEALDLPALKRFFTDIATHAEAERLRTAGLLTPDNPTLSAKRRLAASIDRILPHIVAALDRSAAASLPPADLAALLTPPAPQNDPENDRPHTPAAESTAQERPIFPDSIARTGEKRDTTKRAGPIPAHAGARNLRPRHGPSHQTPAPKSDLCNRGPN